MLNRDYVIRKLSGHLHTLFMLCLVVACQLPLHAQQTNKHNEWFSFELDNDLLFTTDQDFTHGTAAAYQNQSWGQSFIKHLFLHSSSAQNTAGVFAISNLYTPKQISSTSIDENDRPFTATLQLGISYISFYPSCKVSSEFSVGTLGECAMGRQIQSFVHRLPNNQYPAGWENQMPCSALISYAAKVDYRLSEHRLAELFLSGIGRLGLPQTDLSLGLMGRLGNFYPYLKSIGLENRGQREFLSVKNWQFYAQGAIYGCAVAYDAVLQGGVFTKSESPYLVEAQRLDRFYVTGYAGLYGSYRSVGCALIAHGMGKTFDTGRVDKWASFVFTVAF